MDKTIENIWKEGFLNQKEISAPKINNLYNQKSIHIIDKIKRMNKINLIAIAIGAPLFMVITFFMKFPITGIATFIILAVILYVNRNLMKGFDTIDKGNNSYEYLSSFNIWLKKQLSINRKMAGYYYPALFLAVVIGLWFSPGIQHVFHEIISKPHEIYLVGDFPILWTIPIAIITITLAFVGGRLYDFDVKLVYGPVYKKLDDILADMEDLRK